MINDETKLQLQAYCDDELGVAERKAMAARLAQDPDLRALHAELQELQALCACGEPERKLPESREFYWSKIERSILREQAQPARNPFFAGWLRILAPATGLALVLITAVFLGKFSADTQKTSYLHEIETPLEDTTAISFHSETARMTVVWVQSPEN